MIKQIYIRNSFRIILTIILINTSSNIFAQDSLKILTFNLEGMKPGTEPEIRLPEIIKKLKVLNPDIIGLQEINETLSSSLTNQAKIITDSLSKYFGIEYNLYYSFTHLSWDNQFREYVGIISKYPVLENGYLSLPPGTFPRKVVWNYIETPIGKVNFFSTHLSFSTELARIQQVDAIIPYIEEKEGSNEGIASILVGDFNSIPTDSPIKKLTSNATSSFYYDSFFKMHPFGDPGFTVQSNSLNSRIDYIFLKNNAQLEISESYVTMDEPYSVDKYCSDHLGVITILKSCTTNSEKAENIIEEFNLGQNYPNPFNPTTKIQFSSKENSMVTLKVFDILGREVMTLINEEIPKSKQIIEFDASKLTSGIYFYRMQANSYVAVKKMILMK